MIVKICGITNISDAQCVLASGADWIGLNLFSGPRRINVPKAMEILDRLDNPATAVALISPDADPVIERTLELLRGRGLFRVQLYGSNPEKGQVWARSRGFECVQPVHLGAGDEETDNASLASCRHADYLLCDSADSGRWGGTGVVGDWPRIRQALARADRDHLPPILLAGGLTPGNVAHAIRAVAPDGVDVCSGVESAPGRKDGAAVEAFMKAARSA